MESIVMEDISSLPGFAKMMAPIDNTDDVPFHANSQTAIRTLEKPDFSQQFPRKIRKKNRISNDCCTTNANHVIVF